MIETDSGLKLDLQTPKEVSTCVLDLIFRSRLGNKVFGVGEYGERDRGVEGETVT